MFTTARNSDAGVYSLSCSLGQEYNSHFCIPAKVSSIVMTVSAGVARSEMPLAKMTRTEKLDRSATIVTEDAEFLSKLTLSRCQNQDTPTYFEKLVGKSLRKLEAEIER